MTSCPHNWKKKEGNDSLACYICNWYPAKPLRAKCLTCYKEACIKCLSANRTPRDPKYFLACMNALSEHFSQNKQKFKFYVVAKGKTPGVFHTWIEVVESIKDFKMLKCWLLKCWLIKMLAVFWLF